MPTEHCPVAPWREQLSVLSPKRTLTSLPPITDQNSLLRKKTCRGKNIWKNCSLLKEGHLGFVKTSKVIQDESRFYKYNSRHQALYILFLIRALWTISLPDNLFPEKNLILGINISIHTNNQNFKLHSAESFFPLPLSPTLRNASFKVRNVVDH